MRCWIPPALRVASYEMCVLSQRVLHLTQRAAEAVAGGMAGEGAATSMCN